MKICLYTDTALPTIGGHEMVVDALARQYQQLGHEVLVLAPRHSKPWRMRDRQLPYRMVRHPRFVSTRKFLSWYRFALLGLDRRHKFDVVHAHGVYPAAYVASLCLPQTSWPLVITSHGGDVNPHNHRLQNPLLRARHVQALEAASSLVAISPATHDGYLALAPGLTKKIVEIGNGTDVEGLASPVERPATVDAAIRSKEYALFLGRLTYQKGADVLLHALTRLPGTGRVQLVIAGDGPERHALEQLARELNLQDRVRFVGMISGEEKNYLLQNALFGVFPSREFEGLGLVTLDSFAAGNPVIASALPGPAAVVRPDETGLLVAEHAPQAWADAMQRFFSGRDYAARLGQQAAQVVRSSSWRAVAEQHLALYDQLLRQSVPKAA